MKKSELIFTAVLVPVDYFMLFLAGFFAYLLRTSSFVVNFRPVLFGVNLPLMRYLELVLLINIFLLIVFALSGLYEIKRANGILEDFLKILVGASAGLVGIILYSFLRREWFDSRFLIFAAWVLSIIFVLFGRIITRAAQKFLVRRYKVGVHNVLVIGGDEISEEIMLEMKMRPSLGYNLIEHFKSLDFEKIKEFVGRGEIDDIILANPDFPKENVLDLIDLCEERRISFKFVPNLFQALTTNIEFDVLAGIPTIELKRTALDGWGKIVKRIVDFFGAILGLIIFTPVMAVIAIFVKLNSPGPIIYKNKRVGQRGLFNTYKFRSMKIENCTGGIYDKSGQADKFENELIKNQSGRQGPVHKILNDPRRTRLGKFLEKTSLDELPQFYNVLIGNMSLVGPRPHMPKEVNKYEKWHRKVFNIKPGITGLAQISGRSGLDFDEEAKFDIYYMESWSLWLDFKILLKTPFIVIFGKH